MGSKDTATIRYLQQNEIFADAFNYFVYEGRQVLDPDSLEELDTREIGVPYGGEAGAEQPVQKTRDVMKSVTAMTNRQTAFLILAIESQANIHYAISVKNMVYDALQYAKQVERAIASHRKSGDYQKANSDEYLSGFMKTDCLMPVITLVIYFDSKTWDGPLSIHQMFGKQDRKILALVPDYKVNLIAPAEMSDKDFARFRTSLKEVLSFIKYSKDADKLKEIVESDPAFQLLGRTEVDVLNSCVNARLKLEESEDELNVCEAIQTLIDRAVKKAEEEAREEAKEAERKRISGLQNAVDNLMSNMHLSADEAMKAMGIAEDDCKILRELCGN